MEDAHHKRRVRERAVNAAMRSKKTIQRNVNLAQREYESGYRKSGARPAGIRDNALPWVSPFEPDRTNDFLMECSTGLMSRLDF